MTIQTLRIVLTVILLSSVSAQATAFAPDEPASPSSECGEARALALFAEVDRLIAQAAIDEAGEIYLTWSGSSGFMQPMSGHYWQIDASGKEPFTSRSLWDRKLPASPHNKPGDVAVDFLSDFDSSPLCVATRVVRLPGSDLSWRFRVAQAIQPATASDAR